MTGFIGKLADDVLAMVVPKAQARAAGGCAILCGGPNTCTTPVCCARGGSFWWVRFCRTSTGVCYEKFGDKC
ncbi:hypothetical protein [Pseudonocardia sp. TRM90224]|uniref:hypothetical protein n=1 Tax=Pseudonocardia sp. TRM90224 TaxID=2812678 RepID=UPI001E5BB5BD|nr:hypothetical protein [Pseudonocardia sp. TRM90224]